MVPYEMRKRGEREKKLAGEAAEIIPKIVRLGHPEAESSVIKSAMMG
jgi:hypothetical protein